MNADQHSEGSAPGIDFSKIIGSLLSNPAALKTVMSLVGNLSGGGGGSDGLGSILSGLGVGGAPKKTEHQEEAVSAHAPFGNSFLPPPPPPHRGGGRHHHEHRRKLLLALKPYLSPARCEAVDYILTITDLLGILPGGK